MEDVDSDPSPNLLKSPLAEKYVLSVDGAGVYLLCLKDEVTIGSLRNDAHRADVCLMADLLRKHLTLVRSNGSYHLKPHGPVVVNGSPILPSQTIPLAESAQWTLGEVVKIQYLRPTVLSLTAVLDFETHRPLVGPTPIRLDQAILMDQNCLLGPGRDQHIRLRDAEHGAILYRSKNQLWCKSKTPFSRNEEPEQTSCPLESEDIITGRDFRFRLEAVE